MSERGALLVTGATGFVGSALLRRLAALGHRRIHALARASSDRSHLAGLPITWHEGDVVRADEVERAAARVAREDGAGFRVVHGAALISYRTRDAELARRVNVDGTRIVLEAARRHGASRLLLVSSVVAVGHAPAADVELDEDAPFNGAGLRSHYVDTKRAAEELVLAAEDIETVVVNPGAIFGTARHLTNTLRFLRLLVRGRLGPLAPPGSLSVVGLEDVVEGARLALERGRSGRRYLLTTANYELAELFALGLRLAGSPRRIRGRWPRPVWTALEASVTLVDRLRPLQVMTPTMLRLLGKHFRFDARRAREELGWSPAPFPRTLSEAVLRMRERGWIP